MADTLAQVAAARQIYEQRLFRDPNVVGIGSGFKRRGGQLGDEPALVVFVAAKIPAGRLPPSRVLPRSLEFYSPLAGGNLQVTTDVVEVDRVFAYANTGRYRPAPGGVSIGHPSVTAGTLGGYVQDRRTGELLLLSNNHVLAGQNAAQAGDPILQQASLDGGNADDVFARLERWVPLDFSSTGMNLVDAAVAKPVNGGAVDLSLMGLGEGPNALGAAQPGARVQKTGRSTEHTAGGEIMSVDATFWVDYCHSGTRRAGFRDTIVVLGPSRFSQPGDSGSLLLTEEEDPKLVGLLFAGNASGTFSLGNHIQHVFNLLDLELVSALRDILRETSWEHRDEDLGLLRKQVLRALPSAEGYLAALQKHNAELWRILHREPVLREQATRLLVPLLNAFFTSANPRDLVFDRLYFAEMRALLEGIKAVASSPLQEALDWIYGELWRYENKDIHGILQELKDPQPGELPATKRGKPARAALAMAAMLSAGGGEGKRAGNRRHSG